MREGGREGRRGGEREEEEQEQEEGEEEQEEKRKRIPLLVLILILLALALVLLLLLLLRRTRTLPHYLYYRSCSLLALRHTTSTTAASTHLYLEARISSDQASNLALLERNSESQR